MSLKVEMRERRRQEDREERDENYSGMGVSVRDKGSRGSDVGQV